MLDYGEFVAVTIHLQRMENDEHFRRAFMFFDKDDSGYIELGELCDALADESGDTDSDVINEIMREVDTDKVEPSQPQHRFSSFLVPSSGKPWSLTCCFNQCLSFFFPPPNLNIIFQDGRISYDEFVAMMKTGTDWRKASRQYSRERFKSLSLNLMKDGSLHLHDALTGQSVAV